MNNLESVESPSSPSIPPIDNNKHQGRFKKIFTKEAFLNIWNRCISELCALIRRISDLSIKKIFYSNPNEIEVKKVQRIASKVFRSKVDKDNKIETYGIELSKINGKLKDDLKNLSVEERNLYSDPIFDAIQTFTDSNISELHNHQGAVFEEFINRHPQLKITEKFETFKEKLEGFIDENKNLINTLKLAHKSFNKAYQNALQKADKLHLEQADLFKNKMPSIDPETQAVTCTSEQFITASELVRKTFPAISQLANTPAEVACGTRLLQIILCGQGAIATLPMPPEQALFELTELKDQFIQTPIEDIPEGSTPIQFLFDSQETIKDKDLEDMRVNFPNMEKHQLLFMCKTKAMLNQFYNDGIERTGFTFKTAEHEIEMGKGEVKAFKAMKTSYVNFLKQNPEQVKELITANRSSRLFQEALETYPPSKEALETSNFPQEVLDKMVEISCKEHIQEKFKEIFNAISLEESDIDEIAYKSKCEIKDVEPLVRMKTFELFIILTQAVQGPISANVTELVMNIEPFGALPPRGTKGVIYTFDDSFDRFTCAITNKFTPPVETAKELGITEYVRNEIPLAEAKGSYVVPFLHAEQFEGPESAPHLQNLQNVKFTWKAPKKVVDYLIETVTHHNLPERLS